MAEEKHRKKAKEEERLILFAKPENLLLNNFSEANFLSSGAEQKVYVTEEKQTPQKLTYHCTIWLIIVARSVYQTSKGNINKISQLR